MYYNDTEYYDPEYYDPEYYDPEYYDPDWNPSGINTPSEFGWGDEWESGETW